MGHKAWNKNLTKETDERVAKYVNKNKGKKRSKDQKKRISDGHMGQKAWNKNIPASEKTKNNMSKSQKIRFSDPKEREKNVKTRKIFFQTLEGDNWRREHSKRMKKFYLTPEGKIFSKKHSKEMRKIKKEYYKKYPEVIEKLAKNGYGIKCYSDDDVYHYSLQERDCYDWVRKELKLKIDRFGRFDFIVENKIVLEYHPCPYFLDRRTPKQYYKDRRNLLDEYRYKDLKLIVMYSLEEYEKEKFKNFMGLI